MKGSREDRSQAAYDEAVGLSGDLRANDGLMQAEDLRNRWYRCFRAVALRLGFTSTDADLLFSQLPQTAMWDPGNSYADSLRHLASDLAYCSDRWCLSRLMRCHSRYLEAMDWYRFAGRLLEAARREAAGGR